MAVGVVLAAGVAEELDADADAEAEAVEDVAEIDPGDVQPPAGAGVALMWLFALRRVSRRGQLPTWSGQLPQG